MNENDYMILIISNNDLNAIKK